tara:strand:+ start:227 stop:538 length:312 start_codon:yes stop_codon:yes gene_type:complete
MIKLPLNSVYQTPGIRNKMKSHFVAQQIHYALIKHSLGDWGDLDEEDNETNNKNLLTGNRILSAYHFDESYTESGKKKFRRIKFWIITDAGHEITTILLPSEY